MIPYVTDQLAMARLPRSTYSLMVALLPATAVVVGVIVLGQLPSPAELVAVGARDRRRRGAPRAPQAPAALGRGPRRRGGRPDRCAAGGSASGSAALGLGRAGTGVASATRARRGTDDAQRQRQRRPFRPRFSLLPRRRSTDGEPGPVSASASTAAISTALYS